MLYLNFFWRSALSLGCRVNHAVGLWIHFGEINLKDGNTESFKLADIFAVDVLIALLGHQVLDILVFLLANFISWQRDKVVLVKHAIKEQHE